MKKLFVILSAIMLAIVFAIPASAVDWDFYGSARMQTFHVYQDKYAGTPGFDDRDTTWALNTVSRVGGTVKEGDVGGRFEYGPGVNLRRLYGTWDFGVGELLVGQDYTPAFFIVNQAHKSDVGLSDFGGLFLRRPMIQVKIDGFKLAFVEPQTKLSVADENAIAIATKNTIDYDTTYPKVEASYTLAMDTFSVKLFGGWNAFEVVAADNNNNKEYEYDIISYIYGVAGVVNVGPVTLKAMYWEGQNVGLYGLNVPHEVDSEPDYNNIDDEVRDNNGYGGIASIGVKINDVIGIEAGYGYVTGEDDPVGKNHNDDEAWAAYLQAPITLAQGVTVVPEIGHYDYEEDDTKTNEGHESYFGAKWQINF